MGKYVEEVIKQAKKWIGKKESDNSHREIIDLYNSHKPLARNYKVKYTDSWCATFVSSVSIKLGYTDIIPTECSCEKMISLFKSLGVWKENENRTPKQGDIIFYDWEDSGKGDNKGWSDHVGIVEKVTNGKITVIEGNINNKVGRRTISVNAKGIRGYALPKYDVKCEKVSTSKYYPKCESKYTSIVDALKSIKVDSTYANRLKIANKNKISLYIGTSAQNIKLLNLLKEGKLLKP